MNSAPGKNPSSEVSLSASERVRIEERLQEIESAIEEVNARADDPAYRGQGDVGVLLRERTELEQRLGKAELDPSAAKREQDANAVAAAMEAWRDEDPAYWGQRSSSSV